MNHPKPDTDPLPKSRLILLPPPDQKYAKLLGGPPDTMGMKSGCVLLSPGEAVGVHSSGEYEEVIVPLSGTGQLIVPGMESLPVNPGCILYNPPHTQHDVINTGDQPLRYIYIVSKA